MTSSEDTQAIPTDNWAEVELFRHQYGELPQPDDKRELNLPLAAKLMSEAVYHGKVSTFNAASVIAYLGKKLGEEI